ncbi:helix-turn-helix domain-containing protein [Nocardia xishanensis]
MDAPSDSNGPALDVDHLDAAEQAVADHLRAERARAKLKQAELAKLAGLSTNTISRLETGERTMSLRQLFAIAEALGTTAEEFIDAAQASMRRK